MLYEWPHPQIDEDWASGKHQWREITPPAYQELKRIPLLYEAEDDFMQAEPADMLENGDCLCQILGQYQSRVIVP